jgi:hypothetical protein
MPSLMLLHVELRITQGLFAMACALTTSFAFLEAAPKQRSKGGVDRRILMAQSFAALRMWRGALRLQMWGPLV